MGELLTALNLPAWLLYVILEVAVIIFIGGAALTLGIRYGQMRSALSEFETHKEEDRVFHNEIKAGQRRIHARIDEVQKDIASTREALARIEGAVTKQ